ncbi:hypothetical protein EDD15DRAFT_2358694 [Pisolithus albus]|nr:hypothetical protein EDD15DRAFT_2358694 [Pisolithus albus]
MATAVTRFKPFTRPDDPKITSLDAQAVACKGHWVITSPNVDFVPEPHIFEEEDLQPRADSRFGLVDCFQWPQLHDKDFEYSVCIPRKDSLPSLDIAWYMPTLEDFIIPTGAKFAVGTLRDTTVKQFEQLYQFLCSRHHPLQNRPIGKEVLRHRIAAARHEITWLRHHPLVFRDLVAFVVQLQRTLLDIHALLDYVEILYPLLASPPSKPVRANPTWMGCFTRNTEVCEALYFAGVPVWLVRDEEFISPTMNIVRPVRLTFPDNIVRVMYSERGVSKPFPSIFRGPGGLLRHYHTRRRYEGTLAERPEPVAPPSAAQSSSLQQPSRGGKQATQKQNRAARVKASAGPSRMLPLQKSTGGEAKWEEPVLPDIPKPHTLFDSAWRKAEKSMQRVQTGRVDPGYRFPKPTLFVNVSTPERKKTYLFNWLSARPLWISQVSVRSPSKFPSPQMWRDFLNTIDTDQPSSTRSASTKSAVRDILGENIIHVAQGYAGAPEEIEWRGMQVRVSSLSDPPLWLIRSILWELYELNFRYELYALDEVIVPHLWTTDEARVARQGLLYSIFPGGYGLLMWSEPLPQEPRELGLCASSMEITLPYWNSFFELLSVWPEAPPGLQHPAELDGSSGNSAFFEQAMSASLFYIQTAFDFLGRQPSLPRLFQFV